MAVICPKCGVDKVIKNGKSHHGKQNYRCKSCDRQFIFLSERKILPEIKTVINRLLHEKVPVAKIARATAVSKSLIYRYKSEI